MASTRLRAVVQRTLWWSRRPEGRAERSVPGPGLQAGSVSGASIIHSPGWPRWPRPALAALALLGAACSAGSYPVDIFPEMHYEPFYRRLEPRRLAPPPGAVPVTGGRPSLSFEQAGGLANPLPRTADALARARQIYAVNCATCHGADGRGQGPMASYFRQAGALPPVDLASPRVRDRTDGQLYWLTANGLGNMPPFGDLLAERDLWSLVHVIREVQGQ